MIKIKIPDNNINERKYILDIIFEEFLGLEYKLDTGSCDYEIILANKKKLIIKDLFFSKYTKNLEYLKLENIPEKIENLDIFAASFFMLTRWEEYVNKKKDMHNRFPATESLAFKQDFLDTPIVNRYLEILKQQLLNLDNCLHFKEHQYKLYLTHDVDAPLKYRNIKTGIREIAGDILKRRDLSLAIKNFFYQTTSFFNKKKDPFNTFDYLMDISEKNGVKSYFFFMAKGVTKFDNNYKSNDVFIRQLVDNIKKRGHHIGIHPTYNAYNNCKQLASEKKELENNFYSDITFGRDHFLRFEVPTTWQIWEDNNMKWDSTLSYADKEGFRCGVCYEFSVFNILTRKKLKLKEKPLIVMEACFPTYQPDITPTDMEKKILNLINQVKKYNGNFVFLWHNSSFNTHKWNRYQSIYEKILK